jgi:hypothetical protein
MSRNTVRARVVFSFKAETHELETCIDLDQCAEEDGEAPNFHLLLARAHGIDPYSYLYEVLESHEIEFADPTGSAAPCCHDGMFDWTQFAALRDEAGDLQAVRAIAERMLGIPDLDGRTDLKAALLAAYRAGKADGAA